MLIEWYDQISDRSEILDIEQTAMNRTAMDRAAMFGDGFFTTGVIESGQLQLKEYHLQRIQHSIERLLFKPIELTTISELIESACKKQPNAILRINFSRQQMQRGYAIAQNSVAKVSVFLSPLLESSNEPFSLIDSTIPVSINPKLAGLKHLNRLDSVLAASQLTDPHSEALMYRDEWLVCGSKSNVFVYLDDSWQTPQLNHAGVAGIMRQSVLDAMDKISQAYKITDIKRAQLTEVKSAFITNCVMGLVPVNRINGLTIDTGLTINLKKQLSL